MNKNNKNIIVFDFNAPYLNNILLIEEKNKNAISIIDNIIKPKNEFDGVGAIYISKIVGVEKNLNAFFIEYENGKTGFINFRKLAENDIKLRNLDKSAVIGKMIIVQKIKEARNKKNPLFSGKITLIGRYLIIYPLETKGFTISNKIVEDSKKKYVHKMMESIKANCFIIGRQNCSLVSIQKVKSEYKQLIDDWEKSIKNNDKNEVKMIMPSISFFNEFLYNKINCNTTEIYINNKEEYVKYRSIIRKINTKISVKYADYTNIYIDKNFNMFSSIFKSELKLPSGGDILFEGTEAMTVIDINSGSTKSSDNIYDNIKQINIEALDMILTQIKWREISGLIAIDFIDMYKKKDRFLLEDMMRSKLAKDDNTSKLSVNNSFGVVLITRERKYTPLLEYIKQHQNEWIIYKMYHVLLKHIYNNKTKNLNIYVKTDLFCDFYNNCLNRLQKIIDSKQITLNVHPIDKYNRYMMAKNIDFHIC